MNILVITEGPGDKEIYRHWIPTLNPNLSFVDNLQQIQSDNFSIIQGQGNPNYFDIIDRAIYDVNELGNIDRLVIAVDSEDMSKDEKRQEIEDYINGKVCSAEIIVLVQHFCIETWALGNQKACSANPTTHPLIAYKRYFDVRQNDPELLLPWSSLELNRAQFAYKYLRAMLSDKYIRLSYKKGKPDVLTNKGYFNQIVSRYNRTGHINSFEVFIQAFSNP